MRELFNKFSFLTYAAMVSFLLGFGQHSQASIIVTSFEQNVHNGGFSGTTDISSPFVAPLGISSASGYANITASSISSTSLDMSFELGMPGGDPGRDFVTQVIHFHVDSATPFSTIISESPSGANGYNALETVLSGTIDGTIISDLNYIGVSISHSGVLTPGQDYALSQFADINGTSFASAVGSAHLTTSVPEPSSFVLLGLGGICLGIGAYRRRRATAV